MSTTQKSNKIPNIHQLITNNYGENYWFNGCARYVMESLNEPDYDYGFFAGLTGDNFTQYYALNGGYFGDSATDVLINSNTVPPHEYFEDIFLRCGYSSTFVYSKDLVKNSEMYMQTLKKYIDKGIPVILFGHHHVAPYCVFVGYEKDGEILLYITGENTEPERMLKKDAVGDGITDQFGWNKFGWIFVGEKKEQKDLKQIYRDAVIRLPKLLTTKTDSFCFGAEAFRAWADEIENGRFASMTPDKFDSWFMYATYVCCLATNSGAAQCFLEKAQSLNPDMDFLGDICNLYKRTGDLWNELEAIGGGFNITLVALQNLDSRLKIVSTIRKFGDCMDGVVRILNKN